MTVIDVHQHVGGLSASYVGGGHENRPAADSDVDTESDSRARRGLMDYHKVDSAFILPSHGYLRPNGIQDTRRINNGIAAYRDAWPERFVAAGGVVEPLYGDVGLEELARIKNELGMIGVTFHTRFQGVSVSSPWVKRYIGAMEELELIPFLHAVADVPDESLWRVAALARAFPRLELFVFDGFSSVERSWECFEVARSTPNLVFDTGLARNVDFLVDWVAEFGADRLVYGSDLYIERPSHRQGAVLSGIREAAVSDETKEKILHLNAERVISQFR